jgi:hypothetical protein
VARLLFDHPEHEQPKLAVVERPATALAAPNVTAAMFTVAIVTVNAVVAVMVVVAVVAKPPAMAPMRIFGVWTVSGAPVSVLHSRDISLDISNVKIYLDTICACAGASSHTLGGGCEHRIPPFEGVFG